MPDADPALDDLLADWPDAESAPTPESEAGPPGDVLSDCEAVIGHAFADRTLLDHALVHASAAVTRHDSNERLEFLGDAIFGAVVCEAIYERFPRKSEGELTRIKSAVVSRRTCAAMTRSLGLDRYVVVGRGVTSRTGRMPSSILAAVYEAVVAALYLDAGYEAAAAFVRRTTEEHVSEQSRPEDSENYKSILQHRVQRDLDATPEYAVTGERGPDHLKAFRVAVRVGERTFPAAWGGNKKQAEQHAAANALADLDGAEPPHAEE